MKEKRSRLQPLLYRLRKEFNISVAEVDRQDIWDEAVIACAHINQDTAQATRTLQKVTTWIESYYPDLEVDDDQLELI